MSAPALERTVPATVPACQGLHGLFDAAADALEAAAAGLLADASVVEAAVDVCSACPVSVRQACLAAALGRREGYGVYGGLSPLQRQPLLAELDAASFLLEPVAVERHGRAAYNAGCRCEVCRADNARYVAERRAEPCHTRREAQDVEQLTMWEAE